MKSQVKPLPKSEMQITITVPYDVYKKWEKKAVEDIGKKIKVDGFRSGHIPEDVVREKAGKESVFGAALDYVIPKTYMEAVKEHDLQVIAQPKVDIKKEIEKEGDDFIYEAVVAVMPVIKMGDYKKIKVAKKEVKVDKKEVDETINMLMERHAQWQHVKRKAKKGDRAIVGFEGFDEDGKAIPNTVSKNHPVILGSETMVPGFEDAIIGMETGQEKEFEVTFPKDYHAKPMQGKKVRFKLSLNELEEKKEQKLDEDMVQKITGEKKSMDEFRKLVEENLKSEKEQQISAEHDSKVIEEVIKITKVDVPQALIEHETDVMLEHRKQRVAQQGMQWSQFLQHIKKTEEDFKKEASKEAEKRVIARLGIDHIIKDAKLGAEDKEVEEKIEESVAGLPKEHHEKAREHYNKPETRNQLAHSISADKLIKMMTK